MVLMVTMRVPAPLPGPPNKYYFATALRLANSLLWVVTDDGFTTISVHRMASTAATTSIANTRSLSFPAPQFYLRNFTLAVKPIGTPLDATSLNVCFDVSSDGGSAVLIREWYSTYVHSVVVVVASLGRRMVLAMIWFRLSTKPPQIKRYSCHGDVRDHVVCARGCSTNASATSVHNGSADSTMCASSVRLCGACCVVSLDPFVRVDVHDVLLFPIPHCRRC